MASTADGQARQTAAVFRRSDRVLFDVEGVVWAAAPGAGAVILFTILSGVGFTNEIALSVYALILAINRPIEMLVTALNVTGDTACAMAVAKSEDGLDENAFNAESGEYGEEITKSSI